MEKETRRRLLRVALAALALAAAAALFLALRPPCLILKSTGLYCGACGFTRMVEELLQGLGRDLTILESIEPEPSLGNGGLGRLAACFLDSIAALGLPGDGVGLNYHYGLFHQRL